MTEKVSGISALFGSLGHIERCWLRLTPCTCRWMTSYSCPCKAPIVTINSTVYQAEPIVWSIMIFAMVFWMFNFCFGGCSFFSFSDTTFSPVKPGNTDSKFPSHRNVSGDMTTAQAVNCSTVFVSRSNGFLIRKVQVNDALPCLEAWGFRWQGPERVFTVNWDYLTYIERQKMGRNEHTSSL